MNEMKVFGGGVLSLLLLLTLSLSGCSDDTAPVDPGGEPVESIELVGVTVFADAVARATATPDRDNAAVVLVEKARLGPVPTSQTGGRDLATAVVGTETTMSYDINGDGTEDSVYVFVTSVDEITFIAWQDGGLCNLGWIASNVAYHLLGACNLPEVIACTSPVGVDVHACNVCRDGGACEACTVVGTSISCPDEAPDPTPDVSPLCDPPCVGGAMCVDGECVGGVDPEPDAEVEPEPDAQPDPDPEPPVSSGECSGACLEQSGAVCCTTCGCQGEILCEPVCGSGFLWDCEIGCCFDYDTFECECSGGAVWNAEKNCCEDDGVCQD